MSIIRAASNNNKNIYLNGGGHRSAEPFEVFYCMKKNKLEKQLTFPFCSEEFMQFWDILTAEKKWKNKSVNALQMALNKLSNYSEEVAIQAIKNAISGNYQGIFPESVKTINNNQASNVMKAGQKSLQTVLNTNINGIEQTIG